MVIRAALRLLPVPGAQGLRLLSAARRLLADVFGFESFRAGQEAVIEALLAGRHVLTVMPTGSGKSLCFEVPALVGNQRSGREGDMPCKPNDNAQLRPSRVRRWRAQQRPVFTSTQTAARERTPGPRRTHDTTEECRRQRTAMERLIRTGTRRLAILIDTADGLPLASFDQAVKAAWEVTREREIRVWALWHSPGVMGRMVGVEEAELEHLQMVLGEQAGAESEWRSKMYCTDSSSETPTSTRPWS